MTDANNSSRLDRIEALFEQLLQRDAQRDRYFAERDQYLAERDRQLQKRARLLEERDRLPR